MTAQPSPLAAALRRYVADELRELATQWQQRAARLQPATTLAAQRQWSDPRRLAGGPGLIVVVGGVSVWVGGFAFAAVVLAVAAALGLTYVLITAYVRWVERIPSDHTLLHAAYTQGVIAGLSNCATDALHHAQALLTATSIGTDHTQNGHTTEPGR